MPKLLDDISTNEFKSINIKTNYYVLMLTGTLSHQGHSLENITFGTIFGYKVENIHTLDAVFTGKKHMAFYWGGLTEWDARVTSVYSITKEEGSTSGLYQLDYLTRNNSDWFYFQLDSVYLDELSFPERLTFAFPAMCRLE